MDKKVPNPNGKKGGKEHQDKVQEIVESLKNQNLDSQIEYPIDIINGQKKRRWVDVIGIKKQQDGNDKVIKLFQVGNTLKNGQPVKRERDAIADIEKSQDLKVDFVSKNK